MDNGVHSTEDTIFLANDLFFVGKMNYLTQKGTSSVVLRLKVVLCTFLCTMENKDYELLFVHTIIPLKNATVFVSKSNFVMRHSLQNENGTLNYVFLSQIIVTKVV